MINVLRKIRHNLLSKNSFLKYLLYLTGEIVLVIVGILIALNINNRNEERKNEEKVKATLLQIQQELEIDINKATELIEYYRVKDSLISLVLGEKLTLADYQAPVNSGLFSVITNVVDLVTTNNAYNSLMRNIDNIPVRFTPLIADLNQVYIDDKTQVDYYNNSISELANKVLDKWSAEYEWYSQLFTGITSDAPIQYFLNSPFYKNEVVTYNVISMQNHLQFIKEYRNDAIKSYLKIAALVNPTEPIEKSFVVPRYMYQNITGTYEIREGLNLELAFDEGHLMARQTGQAEPFELFPLTHLRFYAVNGKAIINFKKDTNRAYTGFSVYQNNAYLTGKKIQ
ncbi:hypothetical protein [Roseivirga misakiensis]|uniref:Uncharacterized protein n=1 Tax=Roseivirga misakiensis TaxID=1563681 RepID=A0A1E5T0S4_9BACT|nr:hypothetical protein [Roseivirga misakiensis]OEK04974.1 hypothetical protein BFP71_16220 [Roseivirga misakiensis]